MKSRPLDPDLGGNLQDFQMRKKKPAKVDPETYEKIVKRLIHAAPLKREDVKPDKKARGERIPPEKPVIPEQPVAAEILAILHKTRETRDSTHRLIMQSEELVSQSRQLLSRLQRNLKSSD